MTTISEFFSQVYGMIAEEFLENYLGVLGEESILLARQKTKIAGITSLDELVGFSTQIPTEAELTTEARAVIAKEYDSLKERITLVEQKAEQAAEAVTLDEKDVLRTAREILHKTWNISIPDIKKQQDFVDALVQIITPDNANPGNRRGDIYQVTQMAGFDFETCAEAYYYGGDASDIPIGSTGEFIRSLGERLTLHFAAPLSKDWQIHPTEAHYTGKNVYGIEEGQDPHAFAASVSRRIIQQAEETERAKRIKGIKQHGEEEISRLTQGLTTKWQLSTDDLHALREGRSLEYAWKRTPSKVHVPYNSLGKLIFASLHYKGISVGSAGAKNEQDILSRIDASKRSDPVVTEQIGVALQLLVNEIQLRKRMNAQGVGDISLGVEAAVKALTENQDNRLGTVQSLKRRLLYHDSTLYTAEPFSPPSEELERVLKLEVGNGCDWARCTYCTEYGYARFFLRKPDDFRAHALAVRKKLGRDAREIERIFLSGGNTFGLSHARLREYLAIVKEVYGDLEIRRISAFTRTESLGRKTSEEINDLVERDLNLVFWGMETGADSVLQYVNKGITHAQMVEAGLKMRDTRMKVSVMIMLGLGGLKYYEDHVVQTAELLNALQPQYVTFLTINSKPHSVYAQRMAEEQARGENMPLTQPMIYEQVYDMVRLMRMERSCLIAAYQLPVEKVAENPFAFRARTEDGERDTILRQMQTYFRDHQPSRLIPIREFNKESKIRALVK